MTVTVATDSALGLPATRPPAAGWTRTGVLAALAVAVVGPTGPDRDEVCRLLAGCPEVEGPLVASSARAAAGWRVGLVVLCSAAPAEDVRVLLGGPAAHRPILVVSTTTDEDEVVAALRAGATSYLVQGQYTCAELLAAVLTTGVGGSHLSPRALTAVVHRLHGTEAQGASAEVLAALSRREREIMALVAAGHSNASIAAELFLAEKTVRNHLNNVYGKLNVRSRADAIVTWLGRVPVQPVRTPA